MLEVHFNFLLVAPDGDTTAFSFTELLSTTDKNPLSIATSATLINRSFFSQELNEVSIESDMMEINNAVFIICFLTTLI